MNAFVIFQTPSEETYNRLFIAIHHLQVDGLSWRILLHDFQRLLTAAREKQALVLGNKSASYRSWVEQLKKLANSEEISAQIKYWRSIVEAYVPLNLNVQNTPEENPGFSRRLSSSLTSTLLTEVNKAYNTEINDILLTALMETLCHWTSRDQLVIGFQFKSVGSWRRNKTRWRFREMMTRPSGRSD